MVAIPQGFHRRSSSVAEPSVYFCCLHFLATLWARCKIRQIEAQRERGLLLGEFFSA